MGYTNEPDDLGTLAPEQVVAAQEAVGAEWLSHVNGAIRELRTVAETAPPGPENEYLTTLAENARRGLTLLYRRRIMQQVKGPEYDQAPDQTYRKIPPPRGLQ